MDKMFAKLQTYGEPKSNVRKMFLVCWVLIAAEFIVMNLTVLLRSMLWVPHRRVSVSFYGCLYLRDADNNETMGQFFLW